jgi:hypothetical protein
MNRTWYRWAGALGVTLGLLVLAWVVGARLAQGSADMPSPPRPAAAVPTGPQGGPDETFSFTYQGRLDDNGQPADGLYDFIVEAWTKEISGTKVADCFDTRTPAGLFNYQVKEGLFTFYLICAPLDNQETFTGQHLWLQVSVRPAGDGVYTTLPRQPIAGTPYAFSLYPGALISGTVPTVGVGDGALRVVNDSGRGIYGESRGGSPDNGYAAYLVSQNYRGLYAESLSGWYDAYFAGIGGIYAAGGYWSLRADRLVTVNGGEETLQPGDVVAIAGVGELPDGSPVLAVRRADSSNGAAVVGVVAQAVRVEMVPSGRAESLDVQPADGDIAPGGYGAIVTSGLVMGVRVETAAGGLQIGDWLTVSSTPGAATKAGPEGAASGALLGKVAGPLDTATGTVAVFVILH